MSGAGSFTLPRYKCHKEISALKIKDIVSEPEMGGGAMITPEDVFPRFAVSCDFVDKHKPQIGGYIVFYADNYMSFSPAKAFEEGYTKIEAMPENYISNYADKIHKNAKDKGFWDNKNITEKMIKSGLFSNVEIKAVIDAFTTQKIMLIVSELSEAVEADRIGRYANSEVYRSCKDADDMFEADKAEYVKSSFEQHVKDSFEDEIADSTIRLFDLAAGMNIDLDWHIQEKMKYNKTREKLHGKKY